MSTTVRPENRRRAAAETPAWADTVPALFRSEGFAEDIFEVLAEAVQGPRAQPTARPQARWSLLRPTPGRQA